MLQILRYTIFALVIVNIPSAALLYLGGAVGSALSYLQYALIIAYYFLSPKRGSLNLWMIVLGLTYFAISGLQYDDKLDWFFINTIKFMIVVVFGYEVVKDTSHREMVFFLLLGAATIALQAFVLGGGSASYGRYSGFYLNPNGAAFICSSGYAASFVLKNKTWQTYVKILITILGLMTLSRTFILTWILLNLISIKFDIKNVRIFVYGFFLLLGFFIVSESLSNRNPRIEQLRRMATGEKVSMTEVGEGSRDETWAKYYDDIVSNFWFGNGYDTFNIKDFKNRRPGVHNTYLLVLGEGGIIPLLILLAMYITLSLRAFSIFNSHPNLALQLMVLLLFLMAAHIYFTHHYIAFISMWLQYNIMEAYRKKLNESESTEITGELATES
jgi:O-antigen ligase